MLAKLKAAQKAVVAFFALPIVGTIYALFTDADFSTEAGVKAFVAAVVSAVVVYFVPNKPS